eukprot:SAG11_NODE_311_length_10903_cov_6.873843_1_plen_114_part_00
MEPDQHQPQVLNDVEEASRPQGQIATSTSKPAYELETSGDGEARGKSSQPTPQNSTKTPKTAKTPKGPPLPENAFSPENANFQKVGRQTPKTPLQTQSWAPTSKCLNNLTKSF